MSPESATMQSQKDAAVSFLKLASAGDVRRAFSSYAAANFRHHNPYFPGDAESLAAAMEANARDNPEKLFQAERVVAEDDLVVVFGRVRIRPGTPEYALVHIFRFEDERIAELWDVSQEVPKDSPNRYGMF